MPNTSRLVASALVLLGSYTQGCSDGRLSRRAAAAAIQPSVRVSAETRTIPSEYIKYNGQHFVAVGPPNRRGLGDRVDEAELAALLKEMIAWAPEAYQYTGERPEYLVLPVQLTDKARPYLIENNGINGFKVKICDIQFDQVTGIRILDITNTAEVEYALKRSNWTPFGAAYRARYPQQYPAAAGARMASFQRYDDGWRLER